MLDKLKSSVYLVTPFLLVVVVVLRVVVYLQNRSLMLDEANLALNIVEKNGLEFFQSLDYSQYCPPVFLLLSKWSSQLFGVQEWSLKLLPFIAGLLLLLLFVGLSKKLIKTPVIVWYVLLVLGFSDLAIRYSTELKQYSVDAFVALLLLYKALETRKNPWDVKHTLYWGILGSCMIWTSMPSVFMLATVGLVFLYEQWKEHQQVPLGLLGVGALWLLNFGLYFWLILYQDASSDSLQQYHASFFFDFLPRSQEALATNYELGRIVLTTVTDQTVVGLFLGGFFIVIGSYRLLKKDKFEALLLLLPIFLTLLASNMGLYSLIPRLILFLVPIFLLLMGIGLSAAWQQWSFVPKGILLILLIISVANKQGYHYFWTRMEIENTKAVLAHIAAHASKEDLVYVEQGAVPAFIFYNNKHKNAHHLEHFYLANWNDNPTLVLAKQDWNSATFWLLFGHTPPGKQARDLEAAKEWGNLQPLQLEVIEASTYPFTVKGK